VAKKKDDAKRVEFEWMAVGDLLPYARNVNQHSQEQINEVAASIREFGCLAPLVIDNDNTIMAGHCRLAAAHKLKLTEVPVVRASHLSETQKKAYILADNKLAKKATTDEAMLRLEMIELRDHSMDLTLTGYSDAEVESLLVVEVPAMGLGGGEGSPFDDAEVPKNPFFALTFMIESQEKYDQIMGHFSEHKSQLEKGEALYELLFPNV
jgi:hypothetical protein